MAMIMTILLIIVEDNNARTLGTAASPSSLLSRKQCQSYAMSSHNLATSSPSRHASTTLSVDVDHVWALAHKTPHILCGLQRILYTTQAQLKATV